MLLVFAKEEFFRHEKIALTDEDIQTSKKSLSAFGAVTASNFL
jgi:hypothetical protein